MIQQLQTIWKYRFFWLSLVLMDLRTRYRRSVLGIGWSLLHPIAMTVVFCLIFSNWDVKGTAEGGWRTYAPYFLCGLAVWDFVKACVMGGCDTFPRNEAYIRQCPLPLAIYPLRTVLGASIHFLIALGMVVAAITLLNPPNPEQLVLFHPPPAAAAVATPWGLNGRALAVLWAVVPCVLLLFVFCWSVSVLASFVNVFFQDAKHLLEVVFQVFFFLVPILYPMSRVAAPPMRYLADYNPVTIFFDLIRTPLMTGVPPDPARVGLACAITVALLAAAVGVIGWLEKKLIFHL